MAAPKWCGWTQFIMVWYEFQDVVRERGFAMPRRLTLSAVRSLISVVASVGFLTLSGPAWSAAYAPGQQLSAQTISEFTANPSQILNQFSSGGGQMISRLRDLLASDPATLAPILSLL